MGPSVYARLADDDADSEGDTGIQPLLPSNNPVDVQFAKLAKSANDDWAVQGTYGDYLAFRPAYFSFKPRYMLVLKTSIQIFRTLSAGRVSSKPAKTLALAGLWIDDECHELGLHRFLAYLYHGLLLTAASYNRQHGPYEQCITPVLGKLCWAWLYLYFYIVKGWHSLTGLCRKKHSLGLNIGPQYEDMKHPRYLKLFVENQLVEVRLCKLADKLCALPAPCGGRNSQAPQKKVVVLRFCVPKCDLERWRVEIRRAIRRADVQQKQLEFARGQAGCVQTVINADMLLMAHAGMRANLLDVVNKYGAFQAWKQYGGTHGMHPLTGQFALMNQQMLRMAQRAENVFPQDTVLDEETNLPKSFTPTPWLDDLRMDRMDRDTLAFLLGQAVHPTHMPQAQPNRMRKAALEIIAAGFKANIPCMTANFVLAGGFMAFSDPAFLAHCNFHLVQHIVDGLQLDFKDLTTEQEQHLLREDEENGDARVCFNDLMRYSNDSGKGIHSQAVTLSLALVDTHSQGRRPVDEQAGCVPYILVKLMAKLAFKPVIPFVRAGGLEQCFLLEQRLQSYAWFGSDRIGSVGPTAMHAQAKRYNFVLARLICKKALKQGTVAAAEKTVAKLLLKYEAVQRAEAEGEAKAGCQRVEEEADLKAETKDKEDRAGASKGSKRSVPTGKASGVLVVHSRRNVGSHPAPLPNFGSYISARTNDPSGASHEALPVPAPAHGGGYISYGYYAGTMLGSGASSYPQGACASTALSPMPSQTPVNPVLSYAQATRMPSVAAGTAVAGPAQQDQKHGDEPLHAALEMAVNGGEPLAQADELEPTAEEWAEAWERDPEAAEHCAAELADKRRLRLGKPQKVVKLRSNWVQYWVDWCSLITEYVHSAVDWCAGPFRFMLAMLSAILPPLSAFELVRDHFQLNGLFIDLFSTPTVEGASSMLGRLTWLFNLEIFRFFTPAELFKMRASLLSPWFIAVYICVGLPFIFCVGWFALYALYHSYRVTRGLATWEQLAREHPHRLWKVRMGFVLVASLYLPLCKACVSVFTCLPYRDTIALGPAVQGSNIACASLDEPACWCSVIVGKGRDAVHYYHGLLLVCAFVLWFVGLLFPYLLAKSIVQGAHGLTLPTLLPGSPEYTPGDFAHDLQHFPALKNHPLRHLFIGLDKRWLLYKVLLLVLKMVLLVGVVAAQGRHNVAQTAFALAAVSLFSLYRRGGLARVYIEARNNGADLITLYTLFLTSLIGLLGGASDMRMYTPPMPAAAYTHLQNTVAVVQIVAATLVCVFLVWSYGCTRRLYKRVWRTTLGYAPSHAPGKRIDLSEALAHWSGAPGPQRKNSRLEKLVSQLSRWIGRDNAKMASHSIVPVPVKGQGAVAAATSSAQQVNNPMLTSPLMKITVDDGRVAASNTKIELDRRLWRGFWDQLFLSLTHQYPSLSARYASLRRTADLMPPGAMLGPPVSDPAVISASWASGETDVRQWSEEQVRAVLVYVLQGPDMYWHEAKGTGEEAGIADDRAAGHSTRTGFGFMVVKHAPFHVVFTDDALGRQCVLYDMPRLRQLVEENMQPRVQRMVRVRKALRALDGQKVFWPIVRKRKVIEHHRRAVGRAQAVTDLIDYPTQHNVLRSRPELRDEKVLYQFGTLHVYPPTRRLLPDSGLFAQTCADALGIPKADVEYTSSHGFSVIVRYEDGTLVDSPETQGDALSMAAAEIAQPMAWRFPCGNSSAAAKAKEEFDRAACDPPSANVRCFVADHEALGITHDFREPLALIHLLEPDQHCKAVREGFRMARVNVGLSAVKKVRARLQNNLILAEQRLQGLHTHGSVIALELRRRLDRIREEEKLDHILHPGAFHSIFNSEVHSSEVLLHLQKCQINPVLKNLYSTHKHALDLLFTRAAYVNSHPGYKLWFVFWHNIWAENSAWLPRSRIARAALDPELPTALMYHPMPRHQLEEKLEAAGLRPLLKGRTDRLWFSERVLDAFYEQLKREAGSRLPTVFEPAQDAPVYDATLPEMKQPSFLQTLKESCLAAWRQGTLWPQPKPFMARGTVHPVTQLLSQRSACLEADPAQKAVAAARPHIPSCLVYNPMAVAAAAAGVLTPTLALAFGVDYSRYEAEVVKRKARDRTIGNAMVSTYAALKSGTRAPRRTNLSLFGPIPKHSVAGKKDEARPDFKLPNGQVDTAAMVQYLMRKGQAGLDSNGSAKPARVTGTTSGQSLSAETLQAKAMQTARSVADKGMVKVLADLPVHGWLDAEGRQLGRGELLSLAYCDSIKQAERNKKLDTEARAAQKAVHRQEKPAHVHEPSPEETDGPYAHVQNVRDDEPDSSMMLMTRAQPSVAGDGGSVEGYSTEAGTRFMEGNTQGSTATGFISCAANTATAGTNSGATVINFSFGGAAAASAARTPADTIPLAPIPGIRPEMVQMLAQLLAAAQQNEEPQAAMPAQAAGAWLSLQ